MYSRKQKSESMKKVGLFVSFTVTIAFMTVVAEAQAGLLQKLCFTENRGEVRDQYGNNLPCIQYRVAAPGGLSLFIGCGFIQYQLSQLNKTQVTGSAKGSNDLCRQIEENEFNMYRLEMRLVGVNPDAKVIAGDRNSYMEIFADPDDITKFRSAATFDKVTYLDIYPGIDWVLYIRDNRPEYDFVLHTGANPDLIRIEYNGAELSDISRKSLTMQTPLGAIHEEKLKAYRQEDGMQVSCSYKKEGNLIGFATTECNGMLVIDPVLDWSTYYGGINAKPQALVCGDSGMVYMTGYTTSPTNIATTGAYQTTYEGNNDVFLVKMDSTGNLLWATYFGGTGVDEARGITRDSSGNIYITGLTSSASGIGTAGSFHNEYGGGFCDAFLSKFSNGGYPVWGTYFGGSGEDVATAISADLLGNVYITGYTTSTDSIATAGAYKTNGGGTFTDAFIARCNTAGNLIWATYFGGSDDDASTGIACGKDGDMFICGKTSSTDSIVTASAFQSVVLTYDDEGFIAAFDSSGALRWGTYFGAYGSNAVGGAVCDPLGDLYVTGSTSCTDSIATPGSYQSMLSGAANAYLVKFNRDGARLWGAYYGGGGDGGNAISVDDSGHIYITGTTTSESQIATPDATQTTYVGGGDAFLAQFAGDGSLQYATYIGGPSYDEGFGVACGPLGNVLVAGVTQSTTGIATPGAYDTVFMATTFNDATFLARFSNFNTFNGVTEVATQGVVVFPNPASDRLEFALQVAIPDESFITISDTRGVTIAGSKVSASTHAIFDVSGWPCGIYFYNIWNGSTTSYGKVVVNR